MQSSRTIETTPKSAKKQANDDHLCSFIRQATREENQHSAYHLTILHAHQTGRRVARTTGAATVAAGAAAHSYVLSTTQGFHSCVHHRFREKPLDELVNLSWKKEQHYFVQNQIIFVYYLVMLLSDTVLHFWWCTLRAGDSFNDSLPP